MNPAQATNIGEQNATIGEQHEEQLPGEHQEEQLRPLREVERRYIEEVLRRVGGNQRRAANILEISRWALARRLRKFGLPPRSERR